MPYSEALDFSLERELGSGFTIQGSYVGRLSHHQLVDRDDAEPTNLKDPDSGMTYFQDAQQLERLILKNTPVAQVAPIAFFEDMFPGAAGNGLTATQAMFLHDQTYAPDWSTGLLLADTTCVPACSRLGQYAFFSPQFAGLSAWSSIGNSDYNAMQWSVRKRYSQGLLLNLNWTWSKSHDLNSRAERAGAFNNTTVNQGHLENSWNPNQSRAVSDYDMTHMLNAFAVWDLPVGRGQKFSSHAGGLLNALIGGWQVAPTWTFTTGLPISPRDGRAGATDYWIVGFATITGAKPQTHTTKNGPYGPNIFPNPVAGLAAFSPTLTGIEGQRNALRADGTFDVDLGVSKRWVMPYNEKHSLQLRWETFNLTNTAHFDVSSLSFRTSTASTFGTYSATMNTPRQMQFALRYEF
jgi:hypothetical protein